MQYMILDLKEYFPILGEDDCNPTLEIYVPKRIEALLAQDEKKPCLLICPGGGYGHHSEREKEPVALKFLEAGYSVFILNYSLTPHHFPTQLREVAAALELIHKMGDEWNCDLDKIALMGFSAGGHLAAHYANAYDCSEVRKLFPESKPVNALILGYPVITSEEKYANKGTFINLLGSFPESDNDRFSVEKLVTKDTPPTFLWHTVSDKGTPVQNSILYAKELADHGILFEMHLYALGGHGLATVDKMSCNVERLLQPEGVERAKGWIADAKSWLEVLWRKRE